MASASSLKELALVPVRGTVYVIKLPLVLVWTILSYIFFFLYSVVSIPVSYARRVARRIRVTWNWTKNSARSILLKKSISSSATAIGTQTLNEGGDEDEEYYHSQHCGPGGMRFPKTRMGRRNRKKAVISSLLKILLDSASPAESEEEAERFPRSYEDEETERVYRLIRDLIQFSKSGPDAQVSQSTHGQAMDLETLRQRSRGKENLQNLISELDQYVKDIDDGRFPQGKGSRHRTGARSQKKDFGEEVQLEESLLVTPDLMTSRSPPDSDQYTEGEVSPQSSQDDEEEDEFDDAHSNLHLELPVCRGLSPVAEVSPELASMGSNESVNNSKELAELNTAMSRLSSLTSELIEVEDTVLESRQTKVTETVTITSLPETKPEAGGSWRNSKGNKDEDSPDEFLGVPKTSPTLGIKPGHDRRNLATARRTRPPSLPKRNQQFFPDEEGDSRSQFSHEGAQELSSSEGSSQESEESGDEGDVTRTSKKFPGSVKVLPHSLSDQLKLLTPTSPPLSVEGGGGSSQDPSDMYATVNKQKKSSETRSKSETSKDVNTDKVQQDSSESVSTRDRSSSLPLPESNSGEKSLFIRDRIPPWKQMRSRSSNSNESSATTTPTHSTQSPPQPLSAPHTQHHSTPPPPIPMRSFTPPAQSRAEFITSQSGETVPHNTQGSEMSSLYDKLPRVLPAPPIPSKAGQEGMYDIIPFQKQKYLHERLAVVEKKREGSSNPPLTWTPQLPPRNNMKLKRTSSEEVMGSPRKDQERGRLLHYGSERRGSTSSAREYRKGQSSSLERDQDRRSRREHHSGHHHHSHHNHGSSSTDKKRRTSSEKHHSTDRKSSKSSEGLPSVWKILTSPSASKIKSGSSSRSRKEKEEKERKKERKERESKHSKSRSDLSKAEETIPRNASDSSLQSGTSTESSG